MPSPIQGTFSKYRTRRFPSPDFPPHPVETSHFHGTPSTSAHSRDISSYKCANGRRITAGPQIDLIQLPDMPKTDKAPDYMVRPNESVPHAGDGTAPNRDRYTIKFLVCPNCPLCERSVAESCLLVAVPPPASIQCLCDSDAKPAAKLFLV